jgi:purine-binding chemotaxis protein CheW
LVFRLAGQLAALPLECVERIAPMAQLARPPGLPAPLEGILNLAGTAVPVLRLDRLLELQEQPLGLYSMLVLLKDVSNDRIAILVDRVSEIVSIPEDAFLPVADDHSFNACAAGTVSVRGEIVPVLSPGRILLEKERETLSQVQAMTQRRLQDWNLEGL